MRDVGVAEELPVERGRGPAIDRPHHVAVDISDPPLAPDGTPSSIHTKGKDDALPEEEERHGILEHFRAVELPGALESPLVAGGAAEDRDRIAQLRPQRIEGSGPAHGQAVGHGDAEARRSAIASTISTAPSGQTLDRIVNTGANRPRHIGRDRPGHTGYRVKVIARKQDQSERIFRKEDVR